MATETSASRIVDLNEDQGRRAAETADEMIESAKNSLEDVVTILDGGSEPSEKKFFEHYGNNLEEDFDIDSEHGEISFNDIIEEIMEEEEFWDVRERLKRDVVDVIAYQEVFKDYAGGLLDNLKNEYDVNSDYEFLNKIKNDQGDGIIAKELKKSIIDGLEKNVKSVQADSSIFEDVTEFADALAMDYYLRGGKGLRSSIGIITEYGFGGEISYKGALTQSLIDLIHTSTLIQDDDMDEDKLRRSEWSSYLLNLARFGEDETHAFSTLHGNELETWANGKIVNSGSGIFGKVKEKFLSAQTKLNQGQMRDIASEIETNLFESDIEDYNRTIWEKTGYLYHSAVEIGAYYGIKNSEDLEDEEIPSDIINSLRNYDFYTSSIFQMADDLLELRDRIKKLGEKYLDDEISVEVEKSSLAHSHRFAEGIDNFSEIEFEDENGEEATGKSFTDIDNRITTAPAIATKNYLKKEQEETDNPNYRPFDLYKFYWDREYAERNRSVRAIEKLPYLGDLVANTAASKNWMKVTAEKMNPTNIEEMGKIPREGRIDDWLAVQTGIYGKKVLDPIFDDYVEEGSQQLDKLEEKGLNKTASSYMRDVLNMMHERDL